MGSPYYMSPEQIAGKELDFHSDMYSLGGVSIYELLTGKKPFTAETIEMLVQRIQSQDPIPPSSARSGLPKTVDSVVLRAMARKARAPLRELGRVRLGALEGCPADPPARSHSRQREIRRAEESRDARGSLRYGILGACASR